MKMRMRMESVEDSSAQVPVSMRKSAWFTVMFILLMVLFCFGIIRTSTRSGSSASVQEINEHNATAGPSSRTSFLTHRKLQVFGYCTNRDISISQSRDSTSGIPRFTVQIVNTCVSGCAPSNIRLHCGWFASARLVNPTTFKRLRYDDCLVNAGRPLVTGQIIRFTYFNSFMYPLALKSAKFC